MTGQYLPRAARPIQCTRERTATPQLRLVVVLQLAHGPSVRGGHTPRASIASEALSSQTVARDLAMKPAPIRCAVAWHRVKEDTAATQKRSLGYVAITLPARCSAVLRHALLLTHYAPPATPHHPHTLPTSRRSHRFSRRNAA